jgi:hypothetical protein
MYWQKLNIKFKKIQKLKRIAEIILKLDSSLNMRILINIKIVKKPLK